MTPKRIALLLSAIVVVGVVAWIGFLVYAEQPGAGETAMGDHSEHAELLAQPKDASNGQAKLLVTIDPQTGAEVGDIVNFSATVTDTSGKPVTNVKYTVQQWHTEDEKTVFGATSVAPDGKLAWKFNAHDGVAYEVRVTAAPTTQSSVQFAPLSVKPAVVVDPLAPPLRVKLLNTFYLVALVGLGVAAGLWLTLRRAAGATARRGVPRRASVLPA